MKSRRFTQSPMYGLRGQLGDRTSLREAPSNEAAAEGEVDRRYGTSLAAAFTCEREAMPFNGRSSPLPYQHRVMTRANIGRAVQVYRQHLEQRPRCVDP